MRTPRARKPPLVGGVFLLLLLAVVVSPAASADRAIGKVTGDVGKKKTGYRYLHRYEDLTERSADLPITIRGRVMATDRDVPLSYTNIFVMGTGKGTLALNNGQFWLRGLKPGTYTIRASYITYSIGEVTLSLLPGDDVEIEFWLSPQAYVFDPFQVRAERKVLVVTETGTARRLSGDDIDALPLDNLISAVSLQAGVTVQDNAIHIRGGREDDTQFRLDGISVKDPLGTGSYGVGVNTDLINEVEVLTGGFSAEYGQAVSGVVNVSTKEGGEEFEGKVTYRTDAIAPEPYCYNKDMARVTLSGPVSPWNALGLPGRQYFIVSVTGDISDTYLPTESLWNPDPDKVAEMPDIEQTKGLLSPVLKDDFWSPRAENRWSGLAKLTWMFSPLSKLNITYSNQNTVGLGYFLPGEGFPRKYQNILYDYNVTTTQNILTQLNWHQITGMNGYIDVTLGRQFSRQHTNKNRNDDFSTYEGPEVNLHDPPCEGCPSYIAGAHVGGDADRWHDHYTESWVAKADYAWIAGETSQFKTGFEYTYTGMQLIDLNGSLGSPPPGFLARSQDIFQAHPNVFAGYFQDRISYKGLILNLGLRLDAWAPGKEVDDVMEHQEDYIFIFPEMVDSYMSKTIGAFGLRWKARISPRIGVSFPVSPHDKFFFNYGHFNQWPRYNYVYAQLQTNFATDLQLLGNPNLDPKVTVQYETGVQHEFSNLWSAGITFYSNDIYGYAQSVRLDQVVIDPQDTPDPNDKVAVIVNPVRYFNADAARSLGVELSIVKRTTKYLSGSFTFELQRTTGTNSDANATFLSAELGQGNSDFQTEQGIRNVPLLWDRPWSVTLNLDFFVGPQHPPRLLGWTLPKNWSANLLARAWSGQRYTERVLTGEGSVQNSADTYGKLGPYRSTIDLKLSKFFYLDARRKVTIYVEGQNILNHDNFRRVNPWTGEGYIRGNWDGDIASQRLNGSPRMVSTDEYVEDYVDPSYRTNPLTWIMGVSYQW